MINRDLVAASSEPIILSILCSEESYGYAIIQKVKEKSDGQMNWTDGMIYPVLHKLADKGFISSYWGKSETGRKRKYYAITDDGRKALIDRVEQWQKVTSTLERLGAMDGFRC
ncbi:MAG: PadR family transcriptional regulator [Lentisphaerales bacterium]|nr:PadR family transcriptional regulator [Lentisphaerales bacterium]